jgi:uncharacterized protein DUF6941
MAECDWAILCDYAFQDVNRKMCLIGVFDRIFTLKVPSVQHQSALAFKVVGDPAEHVTFRVEAVRPTGAQLANFEGAVDLGPTGTADVQFGIAGLPLPDFGLYNFNVFVGGELAKTVGFLVMRPLIPPEALQQQ